MTTRRHTDASSKDPKCFMGLCDQSHCVTSLNVPCGRGFELGVTAFSKCDSNTATVAETHFYTRMAGTLSFLDILLSDHLRYILSMYIKVSQNSK